MNSARDLLDRLHEVIDQELEEPFAILGNSYGGQLARGIVAERDDTLGLGLLCPVTVAKRSRRHLPPRTILRQDPQLLAAVNSQAAEEYEAMSVIQSAENFALFEKYALPGILSASIEIYERMGERYELTPAPESNSPIYVRPTLIVTGRQDHAVGYRDAFDLLEHYPRASLAILDGAGHNAHLDQPASVEAHIGA